MTEETPEVDLNRDNHLFSNRTYDVLKQLAQVVLPAIGTLYFTLAGIWGLPAAEQVVGTIVAADAFLGILLGISNSKYTRAAEGPTIGIMEVADTEDGKQMMLNFPGDPHDIDRYDKVTFKVKRV